MAVQKIATKRQGEVDKRKRRKNADVPALQKMKPNVIKTLGSKKGATELRLSSQKIRRGHLLNWQWDNNVAQTFYIA